MVNQRLFKNQAFRKLSLATLISSFGDSLYALAITLSVYHITGSIVGVAGMWLIRALIRIPCQFFSGVIVDRFNKKRISIYVYLLSAALMMAIVFTNDRFLLLAYVVIFILQGTSDMDNIAQMGIISEVIPEDDLTDADSVFSVIGTCIMLIGPGVGGILYKFYGTTVLYAIDAMTFVIAAGIMALLPYQHVKKETETEKFTLFSHARKGLREVKKLPLIQYTMLASVFLGMSGRFFEIDKVYVADTILNIGAEGIVYFSYAMSIGGLLAPFVAKWFKKLKFDDLTKYAMSCCSYVLSFILWGCGGHIWIVLFATFLIGVFETSQGVMTNVIFMSKVDKEVMGMVMAFRKIVVVMSAVIGIILAPVFVEMIGVGLSFLIVGGIAVAFSLGILLKGMKRAGESTNGT